jgi:hypothetical protein
LSDIVDNVTQDFGLEIKQGAVIPRLAKRAEELAESSKHQAASSREAPNIKQQPAALLFGAWMLELGALGLYEEPNVTKLHHVLVRPAAGRLP